MFLSNDVVLQVSLVLFLNHDSWSLIIELCLFAKLPNEHLHRAIYLEDLTVEDLKDKLASKMGLEDSSQVKQVVRKVAGKEDVVVQIDDTVVSDMPEELVLQVESKSNDDDNTLMLLLLYWSTSCFTFAFSLCVHMINPMHDDPLLMYSLSFKYEFLLKGSLFYYQLGDIITT